MDDDPAGSSRNNAMGNASRVRLLAWSRATGGASSVFTLEQSLANQRFLDAVHRAAEHDGWEPV